MKKEAIKIIKDADRERRKVESTAKSIKGSGLIRSAQEKTAEVLLQEIAYEEEEKEGYIITERTKGKSNRIRVDEKLLAIMFCEAFQHEYINAHDQSVKILPNFAQVGKMLGHPRQTIRTWWEQRDKLKTQNSALVESGLSYVQAKIVVELIRMADVLAGKDYAVMRDKDFISLFNTLINKVRLLTGLSTENVAHAHAHRVQLVTPEEADL